MNVRFRRAHRALWKAASALVALAAIVAMLAPPNASSAVTPKIVSVDVTGNLHVPTSEIMAVVQARPGEIYDPKVVQGDLARINALGYFSAIAPPLVRLRPGGVAITYRVVENPVISKISFIGNKNVPTNTLLALMDSAPGQVFNGNTLRSDLLKINSYYERIGYGGQLPTHIKDVNLDPKTGALTLTVQEGLTIRKVIIGGDPVIPPPMILSKLNVKPGVVYSDALREKDYKAISALYKKYSLFVGNFVGGIEPSSIDLKNDTADVKYDVYVARVAAVEITGNTKTKDAVIRRQLRLRPGMLLTRAAIKYDLQRLQNTQFFSNVTPDVKPGPDPKHPEDVTVVWKVTEQKTAQAQIGFGYSGGINGQGIYGDLGYQDNNLHGTGNGVGIQFQRSIRTSSVQASATIPYVGNTTQSQKYSLSGSLFSNSSTYYYPVYAVSQTSFSAISPTVGATPQPIPVTLYPSLGVSSISGVAATNTNSALGGALQIGRRLNDFTQITAGVGAQTIRYSTTVQSPYYFQSNVQPNVFVGATPSPLSNLNLNTNNTLGVSASSIANVNTGAPYRLDTLSLGASTLTLDDYIEPRRGVNANFTETFSSPAIGSSFTFTQSVLDIAKFIPVRRTATIGLHFLGELSTGAIPPSNLFSFNDQTLRGYNQIFYGTDAALFQAEFRQPLSIDRNLILAAFVDQGAFRIRGAAPILDPYTNRITSYPGDWTLRSDYGLGVRFNVPQLGNRVVRIDFAKGVNGFHTSFGLGEAF